MPKFMRILPVFLIVTMLVGGCSLLYGQVYSYIDENGVRVLTNIPPAAAVRDLKVSCVPPVPSQPAVTQLKRGSSTAKTKSAPQISANAALGKNIVQRLNDGNGSIEPSGVPARGNQDGDPTGYSAIVEKYSNEYGVDPKLIHSMIATESGYNEKALSPKGAQGLMQLMPSTASRLEVGNPFDPEENIRGGVRYMRSLLDMFSEYPDSLILSLAAYNAGENLVQRLGRVPAIRETNDYVRNIINRYGQRETVVQNPVMAPESEPVQAPAYRYINEKGILVLTNIPPVVRSGNPGANGGSGSVFR